MNRNYAFLVAGSLMFGLGLGIYEFVLPYFLDEHGISMQRLGVIYAAGAMFVFIVRVYAGELSDRVGRKSLYAASLLVTSAVSGLTPYAPIFWMQMVLKSLRDAGSTVFDSMYQLALHDEERWRYLDRMGKVRGLEAIAAAAGVFGAGWLLVSRAYTGAFALSAFVLFAAAVMFLAGYRQRAGKTRQSTGESLPGIFALDLPRPLLVLAASAFVFTAGLAVSHCFVMQLFWSRQFGVSPAGVGTILMIHRLTLGLPMLFVGSVVKRHLKQIYVTFVILEGIALALSGLMPSFLPAAVVWLTHDLFGAGVWIPIQSKLIQRYSRPATRGRDVSKVFAVASLGWIVGPLIAGAVFEHWYSGPFVISGTIMILSALVLLALPADEAETAA